MYNHVEHPLLRRETTLQVKDALQDIKIPKSPHMLFFILVLSFNRVVDLLRDISKARAAILD